MNKIKLCIFDMDGLLIDTERYAWFVAKKTIGKQYGIDVTPKVSADLMGVNHKTFLSMMREKYGDNFPAEKYLDDLKNYYANYCTNEEIPLMPGVIELFEFLKKNNIYISLGTSTDKRLAEIALNKTGILKYFDFTVFGDQVKNGKPNPEIYLKSVEHFGFKPEECFVFEDTYAGAKAAYDGNINLILVPDLKEPTTEDKEKAFAIVNSLQEAIPIISKINNI